MSSENERMNRLLAEAFLFYGWSPEDMRRLLYGDPTAQAPVGIFNASSLRPSKEPWRKA